MRETSWGGRKKEEREGGREGRGSD
jgi:hypothetical protein